MSSVERLEYLFRRNLDHLLNEEELQELSALIDMPQYQSVVEKLINKSFVDAKEIVSPSAVTTQSILKAIYEHKVESARVIPFGSKHKSWYWAAAAVLLIFLSGVIYENTRKITPTEQVVVAKAITPKKDILPGSSKAILMLGDSSLIVLDSAANGRLAQQENTEISKLPGGSLAYTATGHSKTVYNTVSIPRGGQYQLQLADGTLVWLNAASSIRFPTAFNGADRTVELTGEAYFEVAHDNKKPFRVKVNNMEVEVLGTHFNVMAYANERDMRTTLLEGAVRVRTNGQVQPIRPNQQAIVHGNGNVEVATTNAEESIAWKNGLFQFNGNNLEEFMRQIERWYDTRVIYKGKIPAASFSGTINRNINLSQIVKILEANEVKCSIENGELVVL